MNVGEHRGHGELIPFPRTSDGSLHRQHADRPTPVPTRDEAGDRLRAADWTGTDALSVPVLEGEVVAHHGRGPLRPIIPPWLLDPRQRRDMAVSTVKRAGHTSVFHAVRLPKYAAKTAIYAPRGFARVLARVLGWVFDGEAAALRVQAVDRGEINAYLALSRQRHDRVRGRLIVAGIATATAAGGVTAVSVTVPHGGTIAGLLALLGLSLAGRPRDRRMLDVPDLPRRLDLAPEHLNAAFRAAGLLPTKGGEEPPSLVLYAPILRDGNGWAALVDLPRGTGKTATDAIAKRDTIAAELGVDEIQLIMSRVRAAAGGHAGRVSLWVADDDPYLGKPSPSPLERAEQFSVWDPIPLGRDARGRRIVISIMWQSLFFGGLPRRGKTATQRLPSAAGVLDAHVRHYVADGKGGADWTPMRAVAHRLVLGAEDDALEAFQAMLRELLAEMERRFAWFRAHPHLAPEGKLTPEICRRHTMPVVFVTVDELQEYLTALDDDAREQVIDALCRLARKAPAAGFVCNFASQRPDAASVPTKLREIISYRYCTQVIDRTSSDMVLGKGKASQGADASILSEEHVGVGVLVTGPGSYEVVKADYVDVPAFTEICARGRRLRQDAGILTGEATGDVQAAANAAGYTIPAIVSDVLDVMHHSTRMWTEDILAGLRNADEDTYGDYDPEKLAAALEAAGVKRTTRQVKIDGRNANGWLRSDIEGVIPPDLLADRTGPSTG